MSGIDQGRAGKDSPLLRPSEAFFILEGTVTVELEGAALAAGPDDFVRVSRGQAHTFANAADAPARLLVLRACHGRVFQETARAVVGRRTAETGTGTGSDEAVGMDPS